MDKGGKYKADQKTDKRIFRFPEKMDKKLVVLKRYRGLSNKAQTIEDGAEIDEHFTDSFQAFLSEEIDHNTREEEDRRYGRYFPDNELDRERCADVGAEYNTE